MKQNPIKTTFLAAALLGVAVSQTNLVVPESKSPQTYFAAYPRTITLDGRLEDWAGVPRVSLPGSSARGGATVAAVADDKNLYFLADVTKPGLVMNQYGLDWWKEDSVEFYLNTTGDLKLSQYRKGVAQITVPAANVGVPVARAKIGGIRGAEAEAKTLVIRTAKGYQIELAVPLKTAVWEIKPAHGLTLGFEVQLNGNVDGKPQAVALNWAYKAGGTTGSGHPSNNPSTFGKLVIYKIGETRMPEETVVAAAAPLPKGSVEMTNEAYPKRGSLEPSPTVAVAQPKTRSARLWPFAKDSIWNMPIGSNAQYMPSGLGPAAHVGVDPDLHFYSDKTSPYRTLYSPGDWARRCSNASPETAKGQIALPDSVYVADATTEPYQTPNNAAEILQPDLRTLVQLEPMARCTRGGPVFGYRATDLDLYGDGTWGAHFGSGLSNGGTIRQGELLGDGPIRHALKVKVWANKWLTYDPKSPTPGFVWPAYRADAGADSENAFNGYGRMEPAKSNPNPRMGMGALLAIKPEVKFEDLGIAQGSKAYAVAMKLFHALQDYGAYIDDSAGWDAHYIGAEYGVDAELKAAYGLDMGGLMFQDAKMVEAVNKLFTLLHIVVNNSPTSIGGGGTPRVPLAPDFDAPPPALKVTTLERKAWKLDAFANNAQAARMIDGDPATAWRSGRPQGRYQDVVVDMGKAERFDRLELISGLYGSPTYGSWPYDIVVEVSQDGKTWTTVAGSAGAPTLRLSFAPQQARYVRLTQVNTAKQDWAISDFKLMLSN